MRQTIFRGIATALATPMSLDGAIDYDAYGRLIDWQIESGVAALVACGTTGESATMTEAEHRQVISFTVRRAAGRVPVIAGIMIGIAGTFGDLCASMLKRDIGIKDMGHLLKGHGGVMDRVDSILLCAPFVCVLLWATGM